MDAASTPPEQAQRLADAGFIGLGSMGAGMAARLVCAGLRVAVYDVNPQAVAALVQLGAIACPHARAAGDAAPIVFTCLPSPEVSLAVAAELAQSAKCRWVIETSTIGSPAMQQMQALLAARGIALLDCPVSGGHQKAVDGTLSAIAAGDAATLAHCRPLLQHISARIFEVGDRPGQAQVCKLVNNAISIAGLAITSEAYVVGVKAGLDPHQLIEVLNASTGRNSATVDKFPKAVLPRTFQYGGSISIGSKDLGLYLAEARSHQVTSPTVQTCATLWALAVRKFGEAGDMTDYVRMIEEWAGLDDNGSKPCP